MIGLTRYSLEYNNKCYLNEFSLNLFPFLNRSFYSSRLKIYTSESFEGTEALAKPIVSLFHTLKVPLFQSLK